MTEEKKTTRGQDNTGAKRQQALRERKIRIEAYLEPEAFAEVTAMLAGGEGTDKADLVRQALREKYVRWMDKKA